MSLTSLFPSFRTPRDRVPQAPPASDPLHHLRFALETMPGSRGYQFTPATRKEILKELCNSFWGATSGLFLGSSSIDFSDEFPISEAQLSTDYCGAAQDEPVIPGRPCGHIFKKGESCFRCKDCSLDDSCVLCSRCFHATNHSDHNVSFFIAQQSGGCCDCGDAEAWRNFIDCSFHPPIAGAPPAGRPLAPPPKIPQKAVMGSELEPVKNYPFRVPVTEELQESMKRTIGYALDFILDTLDNSPDESSNPPPTTEAELRAQPSGDPMMKDIYCVLMWNDDKHSYDEVIQLILDTTNKTHDEAYIMVKNIDEQGREVVDMHNNLHRLLETAQIISQVDLGVTVRRAYDTFREQVSAVIIEWLLDLTRSRLITDTLFLREMIAVELMSPRKTYTNQTPPPITGLSDATRIDWLFLYHTRLWKKPRLSLKEIYASILTLSHEHKLAVAGHFANVYHRVIDAYLLIDREAETSIKYFALQLFTVPSVAYHIVKHHGVVSRLLAIITAFFTNQIVDKRISYTPNDTTDVDVESFPFKSKRFMPVFSDLRYLCHNGPVQNLIAHNREYLTQFAAVCQLFMCINPNKRAVTTHVEYETDAWISVFNVTLSLSRVIKVYGEAFSRSSPAELVVAINAVVHRILLVCTTIGSRDKSKFPPIHFHDVSFGWADYKIVQFDVLDGWVSFHHSLHWLLAELFKHVDKLSEESLSSVGLSSVRDVILRNASEHAIQTVIDFPLRVLAMIAQIRTGLWVRNGFAIRGQLLHYRDFMLRELCYDQDIFILQTALIILDPNTVIVTILDRFGLLGYFSGITLHPVYDGPQLASMVEEVLYILITIFSETANASRMPLPLAIRREIVHALGMGPCSFSDLVKRVAERLADDVSFEHVLKEVANFRPPESTFDTGVYELKDECFDEINPFFYHYTRNKREEVEAVLINRMKKAGISEPVIVPKPLGITQGPFSILGSVFESEALLQVMFYAILNVVTVTDSEGETASSGEAILDQVLYLTMLAIIERAPVFCSLATVKDFQDNKTLLDVLCTLETHERFKTYKPRIRWILNEMEKIVPEQVAQHRQVIDPAEGDDPESAKKKAARARQEAIMKQMKAQQASFAINFDDVEDDEDDAMNDEAEAQTPFGTCIVCQEDLDNTRAFGTLGLVQPSRFIRRHLDGHYHFLNEALQTPSSLDRAEASPRPIFPPPDADRQDAEHFSSQDFQGFPSHHPKFGLHSSVCTHMMHLECFQMYNASTRQRHRAQTSRNHPENILRKEFICPLCKSLGNVLLPVSQPSTVALSTVSFPDWIRAAGISILRSRPDFQLDSLQFRNGTGEFGFWSTQDPGYMSVSKKPDRWDNPDEGKMVDFVMSVSKTISQQTRHLRDRPEPEQGERGAGIYLPEELVGYTVASIEIAQRGVDAGDKLLVDTLTDAQMRMIRSLLLVLTKLMGLHFKARPDEGREAVRQAIIKRLLPEWSRTSLTSFAYPLLLRDPFTILVETAAVGPDMLRHVLALTFHACLARTVIGLVYILNKTRSQNTVQIPHRAHEAIFGDLRIFFMSVVRHSPVFEHTATLVYETFGDARMERLLYAFTLPFLRRAAILCRSVLPNAFPTPEFDPSECEYTRLLKFLGIPPLADLPKQDTLQNALSGWCAHYGHSHAASQLNCGVMLDFPGVYKIARLPLILDSLFGSHDQALKCKHCDSVPADAAICLICGTTVCMASHCCQDPDGTGRGECNVHTRECGGAIGIYFLVKRCSLLYLYANSGTFAQSPYLDAHGEVDHSMRRGRRQYLHLARWEEVRRTWLSHGIPTVVARKLESTVDSGGWETL